MKRKFFIAVLATASAAIYGAAAFAGPNISDKRYWPNETANTSSPNEAYASTRKAPVVQTVPQAGTNRVLNSGRYQGGPKSGLIAR